MPMLNAAFLVARKQRDLSQTALAEQAGISQSDVSRIEIAGWTPPKDIQERLATVLEVPVDLLFQPTADCASQG